MDKFKFKLKLAQNKVYVLNKYTALCFGLPALGMLIAFVVSRIFPFGGQSVMTIDLYHMYGPLITHLHDIIYQGAGGAWSWEIGMGINYYTLYFTNVGSLLNAAIAIFPKAAVTDLIALGMVLKAGFCGLCAGWFLNYKWKKLDLWTVAFACMYALCGYAVNYYWNIMWMDVLYLLPLCLLGIELLLDRGSFATYTLALAAAMLCNYYIAALMCVFLLLYFVVTVLSRFSLRRQIKLIIGRGLLFALFSILAAGIAAVCLIPVWKSLQATSVITDSFPSAWNTYNNFLEVIKNHLPGAEANMRSGGLPHIYAGLPVVLLLPFYLSDKRLPLKERLMHLLLCVFMILCLNFKIPDFIWHGLHTPNDLPFRYSFCYSMLTVTMAFPAVRRINRKTLPMLGVWGFVIVVFMFAVDLIVADSRNTVMLVATPLLVAAYYMVFGMNHEMKRINERTMQVAALAVVFAELTVGAGIGVMGTGNMNRQSYVGPIQANSALAGIAYAQDDGLWRMENTKYMTLNDPALYGFRGMTHFSSMLAADLQDLMHDLGYHTYMNGNVRANRIGGQPNTPVIDSMLGVKYHIASTSEGEDKLKRDDGLEELLYSGEQGMLFENSFALPFVYTVKDDVLDQWNYGGGDPFEVQADLVEKATGQQYGLFAHQQPYDLDGENLSFNQSGDSYRFSGSDTGSPGRGILRYSISGDAPYYLYVDGDQVTNVLVCINGSDGKTTYPVNMDGRYPRVFPIGVINDGETVDVKLSLGRTRAEGNVKVSLVAMDIGRYKQAMTQLAAGGISDMEYGNNYIKGTIETGPGEMIFTSVPLDEGWTLYVDGQEIEIAEIGGGAFVGGLPEVGSHQIELRWTLPGFDTGLKITLSSIMLLVLVVAVMRFAPPKMAEERVLPEIPEVTDPIENGEFEGEDYFIKYIADEEALSQQEELGPMPTDEELAQLFKHSRVNTAQNQQDSADDPNPEEHDDK